MFMLSNENNLKEVATYILSKIGDTRIICLNGTLGSGKTTLAKEIGKQLGVGEKITSPTFTLINIYDFKNNKFVHIDAYRTNNDDESMDLINDYNDNGNIIVVEWWENIDEIIDFSNAIKVDINIQSENEREYIINV